MQFGESVSTDNPPDTTVILGPGQSGKKFPVWLWYTVQAYQPIWLLADLLASFPGSWG